LPKISVKRVISGKFAQPNEPIDRKTSFPDLELKLSGKENVSLVVRTKLSTLFHLEGKGCSSS
jgi:hypothetical protein